MKQLPNLFTLLNLFFGCLAIVCILQNGISIVVTGEGNQYVDIPERIWLAPLFIGLAALADFVDGFVARLVKAGSDLGRELDSLADIVSFGVAPGMILYQFLRMGFMRQPDGTDISFLLLAPAFLLPCAAAWRLAVFNLDKTQSRYFKGVPVPAAGIVVASLPLLYWTRDNMTYARFLLSPWFIYGVILLLSALMVSRLPLFALKFGKDTATQNLLRIVLFVIAAVSAVFWHWLAVPITFVFYIVLSLAFKKRIV